MIAEKRRYAWMDKKERPPIYEYVQNRIRERALEQKYGLLSEDEVLQLKTEIWRSKKRDEVPEVQEKPLEN